MRGPTRPRFNGFAGTESEFEMITSPTLGPVAVPVTRPALAWILGLQRALNAYVDHFDLKIVNDDIAKVPVDGRVGPDTAILYDFIAEHAERMGRTLPAGAGFGVRELAGASGGLGMRIAGWADATYDDSIPPGITPEMTKSNPEAIAKKTGGSSIAGVVLAALAAGWWLFL